MGSMPVSNMPGPRTNPTVKSMAHSSQRSLRAWQVTLGPITVVLLIGIVTGCMACAFYLGFFSGQKVGLETALNSNLSTAIRLPISGTDGAIAGVEGGRIEDESEDVFASLGDKKTTKNAIEGTSHADAQNAAQEKAKAVPELEPIQTTDAAPVTEDILGSQPASESKALVVDSAAIKDALTEAKPLETKPIEAKAAAEQIAKAPHSETSIEVAPPKNEVTLGALKQEEKIKAAAASNENVVIQERSGVITTKPQTQAVQQPVVNKQPVVAPPPSKVSFSKPKSGWYAQIAAPNVRSEAESLANKLHGSGFRIAIEDAEVRGKHFYRVLVGPEENRAQAERLVAQLKRESVVKGDPFLKNVK